MREGSAMRCKSSATRSRGLRAPSCFRGLYGGELNARSIGPLHISAKAWAGGDGFCALAPDAGDGWSRTLVLLALGHFACCMGNTLASELGILSRSKPALVLDPFRQVPPGTNCGISLFGTLMSLTGGLFMGATAALTTYLSNPACSVSAKSASWLTLWSTGVDGADRLLWLNIIFLGGLGGLLGSMIDSVLGATFQRTYYSRETKQVLLGRLPPKEQSKSGSDDSEWVVITGYDILSNNQVNLISSVATSALVAYLGTAVLV
ncbi:unnamed protein product [Tilletia controversa]|nr:hypothetical protein CF328_g14 [Tilletia controversa]CAD6905756.1 unnamed protein product [Tilletia controversa]CAD6930572.1 unnamed protein product [Tilletia controversa]